MNRNKLLILALLSASSMASAQGMDALTLSQDALLDGKTIVKTNLLSVPLGTFDFSAERILNRRLSVQLEFQTRISSNIPFIKAFTSDPAWHSVHVTTTAFTPELRIFLGKLGYGEGFYLAPYLRYERYGLSHAKFDKSAREGSPTKDLEFCGDLTNWGGGLAIGNQWLLGKKKNIVIDAHLGLHLGYAHTKLEATGNKPITDRDDLKLLHKDVTYTVDNMPFKVTNREFAPITKEIENPITGGKIAVPYGVKFSGEHIFGFFRAGISIGYRF